MTGYLLRKAASVLTPGSSIHPVVRPMFSGLGPQLTPEIAIPDEATETAAARPERVAPGPQQLLPEAGARPAAPPRLQPRIEQPRSDRPPPAAPPPPVAPGSATLTSPTDHPAPQPLLPAHRHEPVPQGVPPAIPRTMAMIDTGRPPRTGEAAPAPLLPLLPFTDDPAPPPAARPDSSRAAVPSGSTAQRPGVPSPRRAAVTREPDEVQIHIGRIEVTAAAPEPVRAPARPPRKVLPLADYLKRRDGRT